MYLKAERKQLHDDMHDAFIFKHTMLDWSWTPARQNSHHTVKFLAAVSGPHTWTQYGSAHP